MALDALQDAPLATALVPRPKHCYRLRFQKAGNLRLVSHIDLLHVFERMMRRARVPFLFTQGFHPKPCVVFAQALALGVAGLNEVVELELKEALSPDELVERLNLQAPAGLVFLSARERQGKSSVLVRRAFYRLPLEAEPDLAARCVAFLARPRCIVERARPRLRRIDIRPYLCDLAAEPNALSMTLWITPYGAARPEEVARALGLAAALDAGAVIERTHLELIDEQPESERWLPEIPRLADLAVPDDEVLTLPDSAALPHTAIGQPLVESPMSFET